MTLVIPLAFFSFRYDDIKLIFVIKMIWVINSIPWVRCASGNVLHVSFPSTLLPNSGKCNVLFKMAKDLKAHMIRHDAKKTHSCNQCDYSSTITSNLKNHMLVHSGEKPFVCKQCNYSCTTASILKRHMLTHSGEKPFVCTQCSYSSTTAGNLKTLCCWMD